MRLPRSERPCGAELELGDRGVLREVERVRGALNLDPAEIAPEPLAAVARTARRFHLDPVALASLVLSLPAHATARLASHERKRPAATQRREVPEAAVVETATVGSVRSLVTKSERARTSRLGRTSA
jgi:hypothetical protein